MRDTNHHSSLEPIEGRADQRSPLASFKDDESGSLVIFAVFMVLMILTIGGIGVDLMRSERDRTVLQHTLDRAILSAADLDQTQTPQAVVDDYFETAGLESFLSNVTVDQGINYKTVGAEAQSITTTAFMKMAGVDTLNATAAGVAEERIANVEISMVLDISGSMGIGSKMTQLRSAATSFVNTVLSPENEDLVSVSLVKISASFSSPEYDLHGLFICPSTHVGNSFEHQHAEFFLPCSSYLPNQPLLSCHYQVI